MDSAQAVTVAIMVIVGNCICATTATSSPGRGRVCGFFREGGMRARGRVCECAYVCKCGGECGCRCMRGCVQVRGSVEGKVHVRKDGKRRVYGGEQMQLEGNGWV
jgi:hypothetical protein